MRRICRLNTLHKRNKNDVVWARKLLLLSSLLVASWAFSTVQLLLWVAVTNSIGVEAAEEEENYCAVSKAVLQTLISVKSRKMGEGLRGLRDIHFCQGCGDPENEGSRITALLAAAGNLKEEMHLIANVVYAVPNHGSEEGLLNAAELIESVAVFHHGGSVSTTEKIRIAQEAGALGVIIIDNDGICDDTFRSCGVLGGTIRYGFNTRDEGVSSFSWNQVLIPCLMVTQKGGRRLRNSMSLEKIYMPGYGMQLSSVLILDAE